MSRALRRDCPADGPPSWFWRALPVSIGLLVLMVFSIPALAASAPTVTDAGSPIQWVDKSMGSPEMTSAMRIFLSLTALSFIPAALICMTSFIRIVIVLSMLRHAIGLMETPPNMVIITLALFLTLFSMQPVLEKVNTDAVQPYLSGQVRMSDALSKGKDPVKEFMVRQTREQDLMLMIDVASAKRPTSMEDISMLHLIPAYMLSELRAAFQIGFVIFLPFLLIDLIVASVLMALGMMMVPPSTASVPLKLLLFVLIDGWNLVVRSLLGSIQ
jgi:flagellar biosynthetic protein FliP